MKRTALLKVAGLLTALPLAMLPLKASAFDHHSSGRGYHGSRHARVWPGDACRPGAYHHGGHTRYVAQHRYVAQRYVAQPVVVVHVQRVTPIANYRSYTGYGHGLAVSHRRGRHY